MAEKPQLLTDEELRSPQARRLQHIELLLYEIARTLNLIAVAAWGIAFVLIWRMTR